jgi:hypothetical protein
MAPNWETDIDANFVLLNAVLASGSGTIGAFPDLVVTAPTPLPAGGNFTVPHGFGSKPNHCLIRQCSAGLIWCQYPTDIDATNLYLVASAPGQIAKVTLW